MAVYVRPGSTGTALASLAANALGRWRVDEGDAPRLALMPPPAWVYLHGQQSSLSSSAIRARQKAVNAK
jgi:nicotinate-nucleotide adenylyltransferase